MPILSKILENKIIAIIRNIDPFEVLSVCRALQRGGIHIVEITLNSPDALSVIQEISNEMKNQILVGAGTVLDSKSAEAAISAGAKFILSPTVSENTIRMSKELGAVSIPGAFTPTEILDAYEYGADIVKVFPMSLGPNYIKNMLTSLSSIPLLATGGINVNNIRGFIKAGAVGCGIGSSLVNSNEIINSDYLLRLTEKASEFTKVIEGLR